MATFMAFIASSPGFMATFMAFIAGLPAFIAAFMTFMEDLPAFAAGFIALIAGLPFLEPLVFFDMPWPEDAAASFASSSSRTIGRGSSFLSRLCKFFTRTHGFKRFMPPSTTLAMSNSGSLNSCM